MIELNEESAVLDLSRTAAVVLDVDGTIAGADLRCQPMGHDDISTDVVALAPRATRSMDEFWELTDPDANKWSGVSFVLDAIGVDAKRVAGLGDGGNDVVWMRQIGMPVAMGNARGEAVAVARAVAGHHAAEGAASFLEEIARQLRASAPGSPDQAEPLERVPHEYTETGFAR